VTSTRAVVSCAAALALAAAAPGAAQQASRRALFVSVVNADGAPVANIGPADLIVREDNITREVLDVRPADQPMQIALVIDNSQAARDYVQNIRTGLQAFITTMTSGEVKNQLAIITIADRPTIVTDYTSDRKQLLDGVGRIFAQSGSGMYLLDALVDVAHGFDKRNAARPNIIAILTEGPEFSTRYYADVLQPIQDTSAALYALTLGRPSGSLADEIRNRDRVLDEGTRASGGSLQMVLAPTAIQTRLNDIAAVLTHEYLVTYSRPESLIPPEHVTVAAKKPGLTARGTVVREPPKEPPGQ